MYKYYEDPLKALPTYSYFSPIEVNIFVVKGNLAKSPFLIVFLAP